ncbi:MAG: hypothetical protein E7370_05900 [Clostridiales bacterium]|nr:hypothetical protein [Clostridiales bacterium]
MAKKQPQDDLDTETTIANMNVEGFRWYDPSRNSNGKGKNQNQMPKVTRKEYWAMVRGAFAAMLPLFMVILGVGAFLYLLIWLWIGI